MKIFTNSQDKTVGGIARMINTFVESAINTDPSVSFHFAIVSSDKRLKLHEKRKYKKTLFGFPVDGLVLSSDYYPQALNRANSLEDLKINLAELIDFYRESIEKAKPDVILINGTYYRPWALLQAARQKNVPYVVYIHGSVVQEAQDPSGSLFSLLTEMEKDFYAENINYIFPSVTALKGTLFADREQTDNFHIINNSLDREFFTPKKPKPRDKKTCAVGFVLRWERVKNIDFILDFIKFNKKSLCPYLIKVVSDISVENPTLYQDEFAEFLLPKTKTEMVEFYQEVDVIINPSFFETFGYVPAEAVASGTPALVSPLQGVSEVFLKCGLKRLICDFNDVSVIHKKVLDTIRDGVPPEEIERLRVELDPVALSKEILSVLSKAAELNHLYPVDLSPKH